MWNLVKMPMAAALAAMLAASPAYARSPQKDNPRGGQQPSGQAGKGQMQVSGKILEEKQVNIKGTHRKNWVALLQTADGKQVVVDLGPVEKLKDVNIRRGQTLSVQGTQVRVGNRPVLFATEVNDTRKSLKVSRPPHGQAKGQDQGQAKQNPGEPRQVTGTVIREKEVKIKGTDATNKVVLINTRMGSDIVADLGPTQGLQNVDVRKGEKVTVTGKPVRIGQRIVLLASDISAAGKSQKIERPNPPQGGPRGGDGQPRGGQQDGESPTGQPRGGSR